MRVALEILAEKSPEASAWFLKHLGQKRVANDLFVFDGIECQPVSPDEIASLPKNSSDQPILE